MIENHPSWNRWKPALAGTVAVGVLLTGWGWAQETSPSRKVAPAAESPTPSSEPATDTTTNPTSALFAEEIRPLFATKCLMCHNDEVTRSGLSLATRESLLRGGDRGPAVVPGNAQASLLYKLVNHDEDPGMPFMGAKLPDDVLARIAEWINGGAPYEASLDALVSEDQPDAYPGSDHWAYQPPKRPPIPEVANRGWVRNPIDAFVAVEHEKQGLSPLPPADKRLLLRRVYLDLIGLPPTPKELAAFLADPSDDAYEKVVDHLLASPRYGERWGRHWMDVWRYSDWYGFRQTNQLRNSQRHIWHWRDWIIESINQDKGYDRMIVEMLAGDEVAPNDPNVVRATGYLARNWYRFNRTVWLQDTVEHTAAGFLGITMKCARCHDHKYDPIGQEEYYKLRAFFEPHDVRTDRLPGQPDLTKNGLPRVYDADAEAKTYRFIRGNEFQPDKKKPLTPGVPRVLGGPPLQIEPIDLDFDVRYPDLRPFVPKDLIAQAKRNIEEAEADLAKAKQELESAKRGADENPQKTAIEAANSDAAAEAKSSSSSSDTGANDDPKWKLLKAQDAVALAEKALETARAALPALQARIAAEKAKHGKMPQADAEALALEARKTERTAHLLQAEESLLRVQQQLAAAQMSPDPLDKEAEKKIAEARKELKAAEEALEARSEYTPLGEMYPERSTGRRLALADWRTSKKNPLTARVAVNHIWLRHMGSPLVPTVANFGLRGKTPAHPELLDWMAVEFMEKDWSTKMLHRLIVTSSTYRMQSWPRGAHESNSSKDPENKYLWRMNSRRMQAETLRDSMLHIAGRLDTTMYGPEIDEQEGEESPRRSVYFRHTPDLKMPFLKTFDLANPLECYERLETVVPHQALALSNSKLSFTQARLLARELSKEVGGERERKAFVEAAFERVLGRPPSRPELARSTTFLRTQADRLRHPDKLTAFKGGEASEIPPAAEPWLRSRENLVHVLFNHNEFVTIR